MQVLQLTQEQINTLPPAERDQINKLVCIVYAPTLALHAELPLIAPAISRSQNDLEAL